MELLWGTIDRRMDSLTEFLKNHAADGLLSTRGLSEAASRFGIDARTIERTALESGLLPARYARNRQTISLADQLKLFRSRAAVIGCGGLGGYVIEELARIGVGELVLVDPDVFEEHNLNR